MTVRWQVSGRQEFCPYRCRPRRSDVFCRQKHGRSPRPCESALRDTHNRRETARSARQGQRRLGNRLVRPRPFYYCPSFYIEVDGSIWYSQVSRKIERTSLPPIKTLRFYLKLLK